MAPHQDDLAIGLQEAIKTTLVQLCKVGIIYQSELAIAGTVGVTVDKKRTILVHFDEKLDPCQPDTSSMVGVPTRSDLTEVNAMVNSSALGAVGGTSLGLLPLTSSPPQTSALSVAYTDLAQFTSPSTSSTKNEAYSQTLPVSIDIDSDSDSLCELGFDDDVIEVDPSTMVRKKEVMWSGEDDFHAKKENKVLVKSIDTERMDMDSVGSVPSHSATDDTEPSSSALVNDDPVVQSLMNPPRLLIDKRLFLKKMSPEKSPIRTRLSAAKVAAAAAAAAISATAPQASSSDDVTDEQLAPEGKTQDSVKPKLVCEVCGKGHLTHGLLEAHLVEAHDVVNSAFMGEIAHFSCKHCTKKFRYRATLDKHEFLHVADKPYKCHICKNTYCYAESLQIHMNVHAGVLDCLICQKMYSSRKHLQKHIVYMHEMRRVRNGTTKKPRLLNMEDQE